MKVLLGVIFLKAGTRVVNGSLLVGPESVEEILKHNKNVLTRLLFSVLIFCNPKTLDFVDYFIVMTSIFCHIDVSWVL